MEILSVLNEKEIQDLLFIDFFLLNKKTDKEKKGLKKEWLDAFLHTEYKIQAKREFNYLFLRTLSRPDYKEFLWSVINGACLDSFTVIEDFEAKTDQINISASRFFSKNISILKKIKFGTPLEKACCAIKLIKYAYVVDMINKTRFDTLVCFSDMQPIEHLAALYFRKIGKTTVTLQHGLYIEYEGMSTVNVVNYRNQPSEYFLAWGENTKKLIKKYHPNAKVYICGNPKIAPDKRASIRKIDCNSKILIVFDQEIFQKQNIEMLELVYAVFGGSSDRVLVRFHPHNNKAFYLKKFKILREYKNGDNFDLVVGHTSSLIFEMAAIGHRILQFKTETPTLDISKDFQFRTVEQLKKAIEMINAIKTGKSNCADLIEKVGNQAAEEYGAFFRQIGNHSSRPALSIIVPCYNSGLHIERCIKSIQSQSFKNHEVIIVDGASVDLTLKIIAPYAISDSRIRVHSSPDKGIYDAMNKGIKLARGEWVYFMGSDDCFYDDEVLSSVLSQQYASDVGMIYGSVEVVGDVKWAKSGTIYDGKFDDEKIQKKNICHQAIFYKRFSLNNEGGFNTKYRICADWDINLKIWSKYKTIYLDKIIAKFIAGGASTSGGDPEFGKDFANNKKIYFGNARFVK